LLAVTVYSKADWIAVGVPEMTPVVGSSDSPAGSTGLTDHDVTVPVTVGILFIMATFCVYTAEVVVYDKAVGGARFTVIDITAVVEP
jgi:hypothetical protein